MKTQARQSALYFYLYFFEGAPIGLIWWTIPTLLALQGFDVATITTLSASATLPWTFKFFFGPVVDRYINQIRHFALTIAALQCGMLLGLIGLLLTPLSDPSVLKVVLFISFFSALQDVVIDAWAIAAISKDQRGRVNGAMQAGMLTGRWTFGAGLLVILSYIEVEWALWGLIGLVIASIIFLVSYYARQSQVIAPVEKKLNFKNLGFVLKPRFLLLALIALTTGFALEGLTTVVSPYLVQSGFGQAEVGWTLSMTLIVMLIGSVSGGIFADRTGDVRAFWITGLALAASVTLAGLLQSSSMPAVTAIVLVSYFLVGALTAASYTYFMNRCHGHMEATKFTFLMAITNLCEVVAGYSVGLLIVQEPLGYPGAFAICAGISLLGLMLLRSKLTS